MKELESEIEIDAPAERVWQVLIDFEHFSEWNPFIKNARGQVETGRRLSLSIQPPGSPAMNFKPVVVTVQPASQLHWLGRLLLPGLFDGEHFFTLEPLDTGRTGFKQREVFRGIFVPLLGKRFYENTLRGFDAMNRALKTRAESSR